MYHVKPETTTCYKFINLVPVQAKAQGCGGDYYYHLVPTHWVSRGKMEKSGVFQMLIEHSSFLHCMGETLIFGNQTPSQREGSFTHMEGIMPNIGRKNPLYNSVIGGIEIGHPFFDC
jgi:hypothetical protein